MMGAGGSKMMCVLVVVLWLDANEVLVADARARVSVRSLQRKRARAVEQPPCAAALPPLPAHNVKLYAAEAAAAHDFKPHIQVRLLSEEYKPFSVSSLPQHNTPSTP